MNTGDDDDRQLFEYKIDSQRTYVSSYSVQGLIRIIASFIIMARHAITLFCTLLSVVKLSSAGLQVPLVIINMSPFPVEVDMTGLENCIKHDFGPGDLNNYYDSFESTDLGRDYGSDYAACASYPISLTQRI